MSRTLKLRRSAAVCLPLLIVAVLVLFAGCGGSPGSASLSTTSSVPSLTASSTTPATSLTATSASPSPSPLPSLAPVSTPTPLASLSPSTPKPSASSRAPAELAYDDGVADGWISSGGQLQYGYLVRFTPGVPYSVNKIRLFSYLPQPAQNNPQFALRITDKNLAALWESSFPFTMFSASASWLEISVPAVAVESEFCVLLYAPTLGKDLGPFLGVDTSNPNSHSQVISAWALSDWTAAVPKEKANWMIRVAGN